MWAAYYYFCRDLELACDERTLRDLAGPEERKQYAQTLVELAVGRCFVGCSTGFWGVRCGAPGKGGGGLA
ncbi:MAG: hypothetical protein ACLTR8_03270 [Oscillospiraceae bacterium]